VIELQGRGVILGVCFGAKVAKRWFRRVPERSVCERPQIFGGSDVGNYWDRYSFPSRHYNCSSVFLLHSYCAL
jgi:hypothetical protein